VQQEVFGAAAHVILEYSDIEAQLLLSGVPALKPHISLNMAITTLGPHNIQYPDQFPPSFSHNPRISLELLCDDFEINL